MVLVLELDNPGIEGRQLARRKENPRDPKCPLHLRRICGTCSAFPAGAGMGARDQHCDAFDITVSGLRDAAKCRRWSRK